jgi:hypothetical protein
MPCFATLVNDAVEPDLLCDPFQERVPPLACETLQLLGGRFQFESNSRQLLRLAMSAFGGLPRHRLSAAPPPQMRVRVLLAPDEKPRGRAAPPPLAMFSGPGFLGGATDSSNFVVVSPRQQAALVVVAPRMLRFPRDVRYELIEFAVFTLAARVQGLVSLHAACVGHKGRGVLLMGASGAGKSTLALQCLLNGFDFLAEDSVFVAPQTMLATGVSNFMHVRSDGLRWVARTRDASAIRKSPVIRRRSGVRKFEFDLRRGGFRLAPAALQISAIVFLSPQSAGRRPLLEPLQRSAVKARLTTDQPFAANQPQWSTFLRNASRLECLELRRGHHPREAADALRELLG